MTLKRIFQTILLIISILLVFIGTGFTIMYFYEGIIARIGEPDQSLMFWYLPILFIGVFCLISGIILFIFSYKTLKRRGGLESDTQI